jgi:hypothetical protein
VKLDNYQVERTWGTIIAQKPDGHWVGWKRNHGWIDKPWDIMYGPNALDYDPITEADAKKRIDDIEKNGFPN